MYIKETRTENNISKQTHSMRGHSMYAIADFVSPFWGIVIAALLFLTVIYLAIPTGSYINIVNGHSMDTTLHDEQVIFSDTTEYDRGDIVVSRFPISVRENNSADYLIIKRIIGVPGDLVNITETGVYINGELYEEPYLSDESRSTTYAEKCCNTLLLGEGEYYLMGDNRAHSNDSRYFGAVTVDDMQYTQSPRPTKNFIIKTAVLALGLILTYVIYSIIDKMLRKLLKK